MLNFIDISKEPELIHKEGLPVPTFGLSLAFNSHPLDFQYTSNEAITSIVANKINNTYRIIETITLPTNLLIYNSGLNLHYCDGSVNYINDLECGLYYFLVNGHYQSEVFLVTNELEALTENANSIIHISGLYFSDSDYSIEAVNHEDSPDILFGCQLADNLFPLPFQFISDESISTFKLLQLDNYGNVCNTTNLSTSLISYSGGKITCTGQIQFTPNITEFGLYKYSINDRFYSEPFIITDGLIPYNLLEFDYEELFGYVEMENGSYLKLDYDN